MFFFGSWLLTAREYKRKSVEPYLCLFSITRFLQDPTNKNKHITPTPNMKCHQTELSTAGRSAGGIYISQRAFTAFLLWVGEILQDFVIPKQALINAFRICLQSQSLNFALQSYNIFLNCANIFCVKVSYRVDAEFLSYSMYCT